MIATNLNTRGAQDMKLACLLAAAQGDGDLSALLGWADWLEEEGHGLRAAHVRNRAEHYAAQKGRTVTGEAWLVWHARYELRLIAEGLVGETAFRRFTYRGSYAGIDGSLERNDGSMEYALTQGYVPTLKRSSKRQAKLGRIIEGLGYKVFYIN
jgi:hypothetical protein